MENEEVIEEILKDDKKSYNLVEDLYEWMEAIIFSIVIVVLFFTFIFRIVGVDGRSMMNTLQDKDMLIMSHLFYEPERGDIVIFSKKNLGVHPYIKRIIATEGQEVNIDFAKGIVYVDGKAQKEQFIYSPGEPFTILGDQEYPQKVPKGCVFVLGDNRNNSKDSRYKEVGMVDKRCIIGKASFRILPTKTFGALK